MADETRRHNEPEEEMRQCPTCRMKVSVWATKCHYCGEEVGRPRKEELKLTIKDLGGGQRTTYAPSGNVTGALESFRVEEASQAEAFQASRRKRSLLDRLLGRRTPPPPPEKSTATGLGDLDEYSKNLSASLLEDLPVGSSSMSISRSQLPSPARPVFLERLIQVSLVLIVLVVLYFAGGYVWGKAGAYLAERNRVEEYVYQNRAREMLASGEEAIAAFEEAMTAQRYNNTLENREIAEELRALVLKEVDGLLKRSPWSSRDHERAYQIMQRAVNVDTHSTVQSKFDRVTREIGMFKFVLKSVDPSGEKATFRLNNPDFPEREQTVEVADRLMDRFIVVRISSRDVDLNDVDGRKLTVPLNDGVRSRY
ncbi:MAG: hypothetical protein KF886_09460 [Candidatus Hydrogenedentes bacterium]|nr:hypothetical protein [Candidatus Hydrogenedentota bacterium]